MKNTRTTFAALDAALARVPNRSFARDASYIVVIRVGGKKEKFDIDASSDDDARRKAVSLSKEKGNTSGEVVSVLKKSGASDVLDAALSVIPDRRRSGRAFTLRGGLDATLARGRVTCDSEIDDILQDYIEKRITREQAGAKLRRIPENGRMGMNTARVHALLTEADKRRGGSDSRTSLDSLDAALACVPDRRRARDDDLESYVGKTVTIEKPLPSGKTTKIRGRVTRVVGGKLEVNMQTPGMYEGGYAKVAPSELLA